MQKYGKLFNKIGLLIIILSIFRYIFRNKYIALAFIILDLLLATYFFFKNRKYFLLSIFFLLLIITGIIKIDWPLNKIIPLVIYFLLYFFITSFRNCYEWFKTGKINKTVLILMPLTIIISAGALYLWYRYSGISVDDLLKNIPDYPVYLLIPGIFLMAFMNAVLEEFFYRGILFDTLKAINKNIIVIIILQAVIFGLAHYRGFPRGTSGMILAGIYGLVLGIIKYKSDSILYPVLVHFFADTVIFFMLLNLSGKM